MIEALKRRFMADTARRVKPKPVHLCPNCGSGLEDMELISGWIHSRSHHGIQCKIRIRCWGCNRFHTYSQPGINAVSVWMKLQQGSDYRKRARQRLNELKLSGRIKDGGGQ